MSEAVRLGILVLHAIGWALVHSLWVGAIVGLVAAACLRIARDRSIEARYVVSYVSLAALAAVMIALTCTIVADLLDHRGWVVDRAAGLAGSPEPRSTLTSMHDEMLSPWLSGSTAEDLGVALALVVAAWIFGSVRRVVRVSRARRTVELLRVAADADVRDHWLVALEIVSERIGVEQKVELLVSDRVDVPVVFGRRRPAILLPRRVHDTLQGVSAEAILAHEIAHVRRRDYLSNTMQMVVEAVLFYHPVVAWLGRRTREAREYCSDDLACRSIDGSWRDYARSLALVEATRKQATPLALGADGGSLLERVKRLKRWRGRAPQSDARVGMAVVAVFVLAIAATLHLARESDLVHTASVAVMKHDLNTLSVPHALRHR